MSEIATIEEQERGSVIPSDFSLFVSKLAYRLINFFFSVTITKNVKAGLTSLLYESHRV